MPNGRCFRSLPVSFSTWCTAARRRRQEGPNVEIDEVAIGFGPLHEKFVSRVTLDPEALTIHTEGTEGPFRALSSYWTFHQHAQGTEIEFALEFEFRSLLLQHTMRVLFAEAVRRMVSAFEARATKLHGAPKASRPIH
jgi:coenzyme Q-binding protein COQ10